MLPTIPHPRSFSGKPGEGGQTIEQFSSLALTLPLNNTDHHYPIFHKVFHFSWLCALFPLHLWVRSGHRIIFNQKTNKSTIEL